MLLVYHADKNDTRKESFFEEELKIDFTKEFGENMWVKLKMVGFNNETEGGLVYLSFPDLDPNDVEEEERDFKETFLQPGIVSIMADEGTFFNNNLNGAGRFFQQSTNVSPDLLLGRAHPDASSFRVIVNARRGTDEYAEKVSLNNFSCVLEMYHGSEIS